jgi:hypothetical protein
MGLERTAERAWNRLVAESLGVQKRCVDVLYTIYAEVRILLEFEQI